MAMVKQKKDYVERLLIDKKLKLESLHEQHRIAVAVYEAKQDMLTRDIDMFEQELAKAYHTK